MKVERLTGRTIDEGIVALSAAEWSELADQFEEVERHATGVAGDLIIIRLGEALAAVEQSKPDQRVVRRLADASEARRFVQER
ncbi:MAG TPA: hypothetical protein VLC48_01355, partial [Gemmatimonadota bacterium]|nr:hypothetical protein [Gemmatimonadota bacterium]